MDENVETKSIAPEIALIAILLIIAGIGGMISGPIKIWQLLTLWSNPDVSAFGTMFQPRELARTSVYLWEILRLPFLTAGAVCGIGLLRQAAWARKASVVVLIGLIGLVVFFNVIRVFPFFISPHNGHMVAFALAFLITPFTHAIYYLIMLLFLIPPGTPPVAVDEEEAAAPMTLSSIASTVRGYLPASTPPVIALIGLLLIIHSIPALTAIPSLLRSIPELYFQHGRSITMLQTLSTTIEIVTLITALGLLFHTSWSLPAAICMLSVSCIFPFVAMLAVPGIRESFAQPVAILSLIGGFTVTLFVIAGYIAMIVYLLRYWPKVAEPEMVAEVG